MNDTDEEQNGEFCINTDSSIRYVQKILKNMVEIEGIPLRYKDNKKKRKIVRIYYYHPIEHMLYNFGKQKSTTADMKHHPTAESFFQLETRIPKVGKFKYQYIQNINILLEYEKVEFKNNTKEILLSKLKEKFLDVWEVILIFKLRESILCMVKSSASIRFTPVDLTFQMRYPKIWRVKGDSNYKVLKSFRETLLKRMMKLDDKHLKACQKPINKDQLRNMFTHGIPSLAKRK